MLMPNVAPKLHPGFHRPYTFDILNVVMYALNDPDYHANLTKTLYGKVSTKFNIVRFEAMPKYIGIEVQKNDDTSHIDIEEFIRKQVGCSILNCFSDILVKIPGFGVLPGGEAMEYIIESFPMLSIPSKNEGTVIYHICFGI